jgi:hypothetical protein
MLEDARRILSDHADVVVREAGGLAALCVTIVAALFLPMLA